MRVGDQIKKARKNAGLTQKQLSEKTGIPAITIQQYERGVRAPKVDSLQKISIALGVSLDDLLGTYQKVPAIRVPTDNPNDRYAFLLNKKLNNDITPEEADELSSLHRLNRIAGHLDKLNDIGQQKAVERVEELTKIPDYQREDAEK